MPSGSQPLGTKARLDSLCPSLGRPIEWSWRCREGGTESDLTYRAQHLERQTYYNNALLAHTQHVMAQISQSVVCHRFHTVPERLARWLLAVCDHTQSKRLRLTQVGIARVLGSSARVPLRLPQS